MAESKYSQIRVAVLYQAIEPPVINGNVKVMKPGGYQDSGADIAYALRSHDIEVLTPESSPDPGSSPGWTFPDTEEGILFALSKGATHLWANTILFSAHPLKTSKAIAKYPVSIIGQPPQLVEKYDDKGYVNNQLRKFGNLSLPRGWTIHASEDVRKNLEKLNLPFPIVAKPIRGRGSHGVKVCLDFLSLQSHANSLLRESSSIMLEEYLSGEEGTVTVMPPTKSIPHYYSLPIITRFNHHNGVAPYNGTVAVTANSRAVTRKEYEEDQAYGKVSGECEFVAELLKTTAPIRVDVRRFNKEKGCKFALFDINVKPNMTGPGRPGREDQACLSAMAAAERGWDYPKLLLKMLDSAVPLTRLRSMDSGL
ncbi:hypothetical protein BGZ60DRAFT_406557 [Tricladium varicosporioides]|nr:hypothetical protein BGZ60DRAFT_406557 [Hymenoscyphus varicosporioides]